MIGACKQAWGMTIVPCTILFWLAACSAPKAANGSIEQDSDPQNFYFETPANLQTFKFSRTRGVLEPSEYWTHPESVTLLDSSRSWTLLEYLQWEGLGVQATAWVQTRELPEQYRGKRNFGELQSYPTYYCPQNTLDTDIARPLQQGVSGYMDEAWGFQNGWILGYGTSNRDMPIAMSAHCFRRTEQLCDQHNQRVNAEGYFDVDDLKAMVRSGSYRNIDELWTALHKFQITYQGTRFPTSGTHPSDTNGFPYVYGTVYNSKSLQRAGSDLSTGPLPRILATNAWGDLLIGIEGHGRNPSEAEPETVEVLSFHCEGNNAYFEPALVVQNADSLTWHDKSEPAPTFLTTKFSQLASPTLEQVCQTCHGQSIHPNMHDYPIWPGWTGDLTVNANDLLRGLAEHPDAPRFSQVTNLQWNRLWAAHEEELGANPNDVYYNSARRQLDVMNENIYVLNALRIASLLIQDYLKAPLNPAFVQKMAAAMLELARIPSRTDRVKTIVGPSNFEAAYAETAADYSKYVEYITSLTLESKRQLHKDNTLGFTDEELDDLDILRVDQGRKVFQFAVLKALGLNVDTRAPMLGPKDVMLFDMLTADVSPNELHWDPLSRFLGPYLP